ncbi:MAG: RNA polymerase subunit sigma-24, partial [Solirubrobacteraceae bacterium]
MTAAVDAARTAPPEHLAAPHYGSMVAHGRGSRESLATPGLVSLAVKRAQAGDREALGFLYARYADNVYGYVR